MLACLKTSTSMVPSLLQSVLQQIQSESLKLAMQYFLAFQAYLANVAMHSEETEFPSLSELQSFHPTETDLTAESSWRYMLIPESRDVLIDELSMLQSFLTERSRQPNALIMIGDTVLESRSESCC